MGHMIWTTNGTPYGATGMIACGVYPMGHPMRRPIGNPTCHMGHSTGVGRHIRGLIGNPMGHPVVHPMG